jgi:uncharacterized protein YkwD
MRLLNLFPAAAAALLLALFAGGLPTPASASPLARCHGADSIPTPRSLPRARAAILCLLNHQRNARHLRLLGVDARLAEAATDYSRAMVRGGFFAHVSPQGSTVAGRNAAYLGRSRMWRIGENIAYGIGRLATPRQITHAWMHSPGHRANILDSRYQKVGVGIAPSAPGLHVAQPAATYTTDFGAHL